MKELEPLPGTHLAEVDCCDCGAVVMAVPHHADDARCSKCWENYIDFLCESDADFQNGLGRRGFQSGLHN